jgi:hypothetical protein
MSRKPPDRRELRNFGLSLAAVSLVWAAVLWWRGAARAVPWLIAAAPVLALAALAVPQALRPVHFVWMPVAHAIARVFTWVLLTSVFYVAFTPYALVMRILGRDPLERRIDRTRASYWTARTPGPPDPARWTKQY